MIFRKCITGQGGMKGTSMRGFQILYTALSFHADYTILLSLENDVANFVGKRQVNVTPTGCNLWRVRLAAQRNDLFTKMKCSVPVDSNRTLHALMRGTPLRMNVECSFRRITELGRNGHVIMKGNGLDANGLSNANNVTIDCCSKQMAVKWNLAP